MVFPLLDEQNSLRKKAMSQHKKLRRLYQQLEDVPDKCEVNLGLIEEVLENHIRFEERELFTHLQQICPEETLTHLGKEIEKEHSSFNDEWQDVFWDKRSN